MATCGLPNCRSAVSDKSQGDTPLPPPKEPCKPCCLPDCRNEAAARGQPSSSRARAARPAEQYCGLPGCKNRRASAADRGADVEGKEVCLYRSRDTSVFGHLTDSYNLFWTTWNKIRSDAYYWSLFKAGVYFLLGLKLFRDLAAELGPIVPIPKCRRR